MSRRSGNDAPPTGKKSFWSMSIGRSKSAGPTSVEEAVVEQEAFHTHLPSVNLLPTRISESIAIAKSRTVLLLMVLLLAAGSIALWWVQGDAISQAERTLAQSQKLNDQLSADIAALAPAKNFYNEVTRLEDLVSSTLADQPQAQAVLAQLDQAVAITGGRPPVAILSAAITYSGIPDPGGELTTCPNPDPFNTEITIGCLTFSATAANRTQVSDLLRAMEADPMFIGPFVTSTTATGTDTAQAGTVTFTGSAGVSLEGLQTPVAPELLEVILNPPSADDAEGADPDGADTEGAAADVEGDQP